MKKKTPLEEVASIVKEHQESGLTCSYCKGCFKCCQQDPCKGRLKEEN